MFRASSFNQLSARLRKNASMFSCFENWAENGLKNLSAERKGHDEFDSVNKSLIDWLLYTYSKIAENFKLKNFWASNIYFKSDLWLGFFASWSVFDRLPARKGFKNLSSLHKNRRFFPNFCKFAYHVVNLATLNLSTGLYSLACRFFWAWWLLLIKHDLRACSEWWPRTIENKFAKWFQSI